MDLFSSAGNRVPLGKKLGTGGEGSVYEVPALGHDLVAKVYHEAVSLEKQTKLRGMVKGCDEPLKRIAAWPLGTLHASAGGPVRGFLMPKVAGYEPIHHLYGPSHRKQRFPYADWAFLVNTARNVAAAFETIHCHGHVIGDVNPNLVFVANNSIVKLIDCDSFQAAVDGKHFLCEVGVPHFTPPELQGHTSFRGVRRTTNHDNFGLALLLFHILLMGRHPFSGVYAGRGDMPLEKAIGQFRYAFGQNAAGKAMSPPPNSVTPIILPPLIAQSFERAFDETGAQPNGRPSAREWLASLDALKGQLRTCGQESIHRYFGGLTKCPWCSQEELSGLYFFISLITAAGSAGTFDLGHVWARITAVEPPTPAPQVDFSKITVQPNPLPPEVKQARTIASVKKVLGVALVIGWLVVAPSSFILALIFGGILFFSGANDSAERSARTLALTAAQQNWRTVEDRWDAEAGPGPFQAKLKELSALRADYENLTNLLTRERQKLHDSLRESQLHKFLDGFFLEDGNIPGIGATRKATLVSFGIETAADVNWGKIISIRGFGETLTREIVDWRKQLERRFVFDPTKGVAPADLAALNQRFAQRRKQLESGLLAGVEQLTQIRAHAILKRQQQRETILSAARQLVQAEADLKVLG